jgi:hypothetical protein
MPPQTPTSREFLKFFNPFKFSEVSGHCEARSSPAMGYLIAAVVRHLDFRFSQQVVRMGG